MSAMTRLLLILLFFTPATAFAPIQVRKTPSLLPVAVLCRRSQQFWSSSTSDNDDDAPINVVNCHTHIMTKKDIPPGWPNGFLNRLASSRLTRWIATRIVPLLDPLRDDDVLERYANVLKHGTMKNQKANFEKLEKFYPPGTKFVVLPMDLRAWDPKNLPDQSIIEQHEELAGVANDYPPRTVLPFVHIDPRLMDNPNAVNARDAATFIQDLHTTGLQGVTFKGIKLYPPLGYHPDDASVRPIWQYANTEQLPVITHCMSKGGFWNNNDPTLGNKNTTVLKTYTAPSSYVRVLRKYPDMRLCLAHFGGDAEWNRYLKKKKQSASSDSGEIQPLSYFETEEFKGLDWVSQIIEMLESGWFNNLYVDTAYTCFNRKYRERLKDVLKSNDNVRKRVLFGSDYYMSVKEKPKEKKLVKAFEKDIGKDLFRQIAETNPNDFLLL